MPALYTNVATAEDGVAINPPEKKAKVTGMANGYGIARDSLDRNVRGRISDTYIEGKGPGITQSIDPTETVINGVKVPINKLAGFDKIAFWIGKKKKKATQYDQHGNVIEQKAADIASRSAIRAAAHMAEGGGVGSTLNAMKSNIIRGSVGEILSGIASTIR